VINQFQYKEGGLTMKRVQTIEDIAHLIEGLDKNIVVRIQEYIDHQLLYLEDFSSEQEEVNESK